jgi:hypothetical protein
VIPYAQFQSAVSVVKRALKGEAIMAATQEEVLAAIEQAKLDAAQEAQEVAAAIAAAVAAAQTTVTDLQAQVAALQAQIANTPAAPDMQAVLDSVNQLDGQIKAIQP